MYASVYYLSTAPCLQVPVALQNRIKTVDTSALNMQKNELYVEFESPKCAVRSSVWLNLAMQAAVILPSENAAGGHSAPRSWPVQKYILLNSTKVNKAHRVDFSEANENAMLRCPLLNQRHYGRHGRMTSAGRRHENITALCF